MIFSTVDEPALIAAVRGDQVLYGEAIGVLHNTCTFTLHKENELSSRYMSLAVLGSIKRLTVD
jgi:hypothetical protein